MSGRTRNVYLLRHGESEANVAKIISSGKAARAGHGLTAKGQVQAQNAAKDFLISESGANAVCFIATSPLLRAKQTADIFARGIEKAVDRIVRVEEEDLRERSFGSLDGPLGLL